MFVLEFKVRAKETQYYWKVRSLQTQYPKFYRTGERRLRLHNRQLSRKYRNPNKGKKGEKMVKGDFRQSNNYHKARIRLATLDGLLSGNG